MTLRFAVVVTCKEARSSDKSVITKAGERRLVMKEPGGWVEATSQGFVGAFPLDTKTFPTAEEAHGFAERWKGHPWYCVPNGEFEIFAITPLYTQSLAGYELASTPDRPTSSPQDKSHDPPFMW